MLELKILHAIYLKNINTVAVEAEILVEGEFKKGATLLEKSNPENRYITNGVYFVDGKDIVPSLKKINVQFIPGKYNVSDLIGKILVVKE